MATSGVRTFNPSLGDLAIEAFSRLQVRPASMTAQHMRDALTSANYQLSEWSNEIPDLWLVDEQSITLEQGTATYSIPSATTTILDARIRQFQLESPVDVTPAFSTTISTTTVAVNFPASGVIAGQYVQIYIPVAVGGIVLQAFYLVKTVIDANNFTITAADTATASITAGGVVPYLTTTLGSPLVNVLLPNHGYVQDDSFTIQVDTDVGGLVIGGVYTVASVPDANNLVITAPYNAGSSASAYENAGDTQILTQSTAQPQDRVVFSISRTDYNNVPDKFQQGYPTTYWFNRQINPTVTFYLTPDGNGPYQFFYWRQVRPQDAVLQNGTTIEMPSRFFDAFAAGLAARLARKYNPQLAAELRAEAQEAFTKAAQEDTERTPIYIAPGLQSYWK